MDGLTAPAGRTLCNSFRGGNPVYLTPSYRDHSDITKDPCRMRPVFSSASELCIMGSITLLAWRLNALYNTNSRIQTRQRCPSDNCIQLNVPESWPTIPPLTSHSPQEAMGITNFKTEDAVSYSQFACVGTGFSAIGLGATLQRWYGIDNIAFFEKFEELGGTWFINKYPGIYLK